MNEEITAPYSEPLVRDLIAEFFDSNEAGRIYVEEARRQGWPFVIDHITIRCFDIDRRAREFLNIGYQDLQELVEYPDQGWWAKVYRKAGYPALFIDQAYSDARGAQSILPAWVQRFGDRVLHHVAVRVEKIEQVIDGLKKRGVEFSGAIAGEPGTRLRQIFTAAESRDGQPYSVLELTQRRAYDGFYPEQANSLMQASVKTRGA